MIRFPRTKTAVEPGGPVFEAEFTTDLVPTRRPLPARPVYAAMADSLFNYETDIQCTLRGCNRSVTVSLAEVAGSPCPLCKRCDHCREDCTQGLIEHRRNGW